MSPSYPPILDELGLGQPIEYAPLGGGCIADARVAAFRDGTRVFIKSTGHGGTAMVDMFDREARGLRALAEAGSIRVPKVLAFNRQALVLEFIVSGQRRDDFSEDFGRSFAKLHQYRGKTFGFPNDNYMGATPQRNDPVGCSWEQAAESDGSAWPVFFLERRLRFQTTLAERKGYGETLDRLLDRAEPTIIDLLASTIEKPSILHGDLWGGNFLADENGRACLIDPAVYFGHREADLAMTHLFGGFDSAFYRAYEETAPLEPGHDERLHIYQLYHVLNHLNLFGGSYFDQARRILQYYAKS